MTLIDRCGPFAAYEIDDMLARFLGEPNAEHSNSHPEKIS